MPGTALANLWTRACCWQSRKIEGTGPGWYQCAVKLSIPGSTFPLEFLAYEIKKPPYYLHYFTQVICQFAAESVPSDSKKIFKKF